MWVGKLIFGAPGFGLVVGAEIAPGSDGTGHANGMGGDDIALGIADIEAVGRGCPGDLAGKVHGRRVGFGLGGGVAADDAGSTRAQVKAFKEWLGESGGFVGDNAPAFTVLFQVD